jgi:hypothetical protein
MVTPLIALGRKRHRQENGYGSDRNLSWDRGTHES